METPGPGIIDVSIHAPARGATGLPFVVPQPPKVSIHAPARGATISGALIISSAAFQSTPPRGGRRAISCLLCC